MKVLLLLLTVLLCFACTRRVEYGAGANVVRNPAAMNVNTASAAELERLPHIGEKTAEAIVAFRAENGPLRRVEDVMLIRGFSEKRFVEVRPFITAE